MPSRYPVEVRRQVVELARSGTRVAQLAETFGMTQASIYSWSLHDPGGTTGCRKVVCREVRGSASPPRWTWCAVASAPTGPTGCG
jgi:hypothetical protein